MSTILLVEGNEEHMKYTSEMLEHHGHSILDANNAGDGIRIAKELQPDLIILGIHFPGMDSVMTARLLKVNPITRDIKIIAMAGDGPDDRQKLLFAGADEYLNRPFAREDLLKLIEDMLQANVNINADMNMKMKMR